jgi:hypothetical protein
MKVDSKIESASTDYELKRRITSPPASTGGTTSPMDKVTKMKFDRHNISVIDFS